MLVSRITRAGQLHRLSAATLALTRMPTATHCLPKRILSMAASQHGLQSSDIQQGCRAQAPSSNPAVRMLPPLSHPHRPCTPRTAAFPTCDPSRVWNSAFLLPPPAFPSHCQRCHPIPPWTSPLGSAADRVPALRPFPSTPSSPSSQIAAKNTSVASPHPGPACCPDTYLLHVSASPITSLSRAWRERPVVPQPIQQPLGPLGP
jgi:hypothetical protein